LQQQLGKSNAHLPTPGKFFRVAGPVFFPKAESRKHATDLRLDGVAITSAKFMIQALISVGELIVLSGRMVQVRHARGDLLHFGFHGLQVGEH
jgi:hypothetical protein